MGYDPKRYYTHCIALPTRKNKATNENNYVGKKTQQ